MYDKLDSRLDEFRLLTLQPGLHDDLLCGSLVVASLTSNECPSYETISYHWGGLSTVTWQDAGAPLDISDERCISILGRLMIVPARAAQALRCMRLADKPRTVWIDSICINQSDVREREQQIAVMGKIYMNGVRNLVHLEAGNREAASAGIRALKDAFVRLQEELRSLPPRVQREWEEYRIKPSGWGKLEDPPILLKDPRPVKLMFKCAWFTRLWIVQETCLASQNICYWGNDHFDLQVLMDVVHVSRELEVSADDELPDMFKTYCCIQQLRYPLLLSNQFRSGNVNDVLEALMSLVDVLRHCDVKYGRDRIFAVAGLLRSLPAATKNAMDLLEADYTKPIAAIFRDATRAILLLSDSDVLLTRVSHRDKHELLDISKPSWSIRFDRPQDLVYESGRPTMHTTFHAGEQNVRSPLCTLMTMHTPDNDPDILSLEGFLLGTVRQLTPNVKSGTLHTSCSAINGLIESISRLTTLNSRSAEPSQGYNHEFPSTLSDSCSTDATFQRPSFEALRVRELERANEVIRRRLSRRVGYIQREAYLKQAESRSSSPKVAEPKKPSDNRLTSLEDVADMISMTVLTAGWWEAQFVEARVALKAFRELRHHVKRTEDLPNVLSDAFSMYMMLCSCSNNRCFFTTGDGDVGCGPKIMEAEDTVAIFLGAKYPYILRSTKPFDGTYRFVGTAIIPKLMHGEVFRKGLKQQTIRLR